MPKKILIFSTAYLPFVGGAEIAIKEITDRTQTIQFDMITARLGGKLPRKEKIGNITIHRVGIGWPLFDKYLLAFYGHKIAEKLHKENKYDLIWAIMASYGGFAASFFKKRNSETRFLLTLQEGDDLKYINRRVGFLRKAFKEIFYRADYIQAISTFLANWAKEQGATCPIEVVPNGVNVEKFNIENLKFNALDLKKKLGFAESDKIIITASRLVKKNAIDDIIKSLQYLPGNIKFLALGDGADRRMLEKLVKELNLSDRVMFEGAYRNDDLPKYLAIADVFVRPSLSEGQGISFLEAMAAGVPAIATRVGGIVDFIRDRETGLFCQVKQPESIAHRVLNVLEDPDLREKIKRNALDIVKINYDWKNITQRMKDIFENK